MDFTLNIRGKGWDMEEDEGQRRPRLSLPVRLERTASSLRPGSCLAPVSPLQSGLTCLVQTQQAHLGFQMPPKRPY